MKGKLFLILFITLPFYLPANFLHKAPALQKNVITLHNLENLKNRKKRTKEEESLLKENTQANGAAREAKIPKRIIISVWLAEGTSVEAG